MRSHRGRFFLVIMRHRHNDLIEQFSRTLNNIEVTVGHRIKTAWIDCASHKRDCNRKIKHQTSNIKLFCGCRMAWKPEIGLRLS